MAPCPCQIRQILPPGHTRIVLTLRATLLEAGGAVDSGRFPVNMLGLSFLTEPPSATRYGDGSLLILKLPGAGTASGIR